MRIFFFLSLTLLRSAFAQIDPGNGSLGNCTEASFPSGGIYNCATLTISSAGLSIPYGAASASPLVIKVLNNVTINGPITLKGENGTYSGSANGGRAGAGGGNGGGISGIGPEPSPDAPTNGGDVGSPSGSCGGGGGGGSFVALGSNGTPCAGSPGGAAGSSTYDPFTLTFRGGFGGGAGGEGPLVNAGTGGGGGGAIHIMAGGNIIINANISVAGGDGGDAVNPNAGGGGGGGSGGVIWIQTLAQMTNNGRFTVSGGEGGSALLNGNGGNGGAGTFALEDSDGVIDGIGTGAAGSGPKLKSDISCGAISKQRDNLVQTFASFSFVMVLCWLFRKARSLKVFA